MPLGLFLSKFFAKQDKGGGWWSNSWTRRGWQPPPNWWRHLQNKQVRRGFWKQVKTTKQRMEKFNCPNGSDLLVQIWLFQFLESINVIGIENLEKCDYWHTSLLHNQDGISQQLSYSLQHNFFHFLNLAKKMQQIYAYKGCYECFLVAKTYNNTTTNMFSLTINCHTLQKNLVHTNPCVCNLCSNQPFLQLLACDYAPWHHVKTTWNRMCNYKMILNCI